MVVFGYRNYLNSMLRAIVAIAVGVVMLVSRTDAMVLVVQIIAAGLLVSGIVAMVMRFRYKAARASNILGVNGGFNIIVSLLMFMFPEPIAHVIVFFIGLALACFGLFQFVGIYSINKMAPLSLLAFLIPVLVTVLGGFLMFSPSFLGKAVGTVAGIALILYGVSEFIASFKAKKVTPKNQFQDDYYRDIDEQ